MLTYRFLIAVLAVVVPLRASTSYNTASAMTTANPGLAFTTVSFLGQDSYSPTLDLGGGLTFTGANGLNTLTTTMNPGGSWPAGQILKGFSNGGEIDITLPAGTLAFGASFGEVGGTILTITLTGSGDTGNFTYQLSPASGAPVYIGISSTSAFSNIKIAADYSFEDLALNNFSYGTGSGGGDVDADTPEPATVGLMGLGLVMLSVIRRRTRKGPPRPDAVQSQ